MNKFRNLSIGVKINLVIVVAVGLLTVAILLLQTSASNTLIEDIGQFRIRQETVLIELHLVQMQEELETKVNILVNTPGFVEAVESSNDSALRALYFSAFSIFAN